VNPVCAFESVTPVMAKEWLDRNSKNRKLSEPQVRRLAHAIERGEWMETTDGIGLDEDGNLINGQHRLAAIVLSGTAAQCLVVRNVRPEIIKVIDQGMGRNFAQILQMDGRYPAAAAIAGAVNQLYNVLGDFEMKRPMEFSPTTQQLIELFAEHPGIEQSIEMARDAARKCGANLHVFTAYHYLMASVDSEVADNFFDKLATGLDVEEGEPVRILREKLLKQSALVKPVPAMYRTAWLVKAWEATRAGESEMTERKLKWSPTGHRPEPFPKVTDVPFLECEADEEEAA